MATSEFMPKDFDTLLMFTINLARSAGDLIRHGSTAILQEGNVDEKLNSVDLVTEWDVKVEELVRSKIATSWPDFKFIGEESYSSGNRPPLTYEPTFCVDPIDGTTNFVHGFPFVCISLGFIYKKQPVIGVIYNPFLDQMYYGLKGRGSFVVLPSSPTPISLPLAKSRPLASLSQALLGVEWGSDRRSSVMTRKSSSFVKLAGDGKEITGGKMAHSLRSMGSAALNYGSVAQGGLDVYWEIGCWPWDVCAGIVIALEAGCYITGSREFFHAHRDEDPAQFQDWDELLWGRKYIVIRAIADTSEHCVTKAEKGRDAQRRLVKEFYDSVEEWDAT